jgi:hypothetical protein
VAALLDVDAAIGNEPVHGFGQSGFANVCLLGFGLLGESGSKPDIGSGIRCVDGSAT